MPYLKASMFFKLTIASEFLVAYFNQIQQAFFRSEKISIDKKKIKTSLFFIKIH